jgi:hypothetical protein
MADAVASDCCVQDALLIAVCIICAAYFVRSPARLFDGYWRTAEGRLFGIKTTGGRRALVTGIRAEALHARLGFVRRICVAGECGTLSLDRRTISWPTRGVWFRQGVF